jgi:hypothetical protein
MQRPAALILEPLLLASVTLIVAGCTAERHDWTLSVMNERGTAIVIEVVAPGQAEAFLVPPEPEPGVTAAVLDRPFDGSVTMYAYPSCVPLGSPQDLPLVGDAWIFARYDGGFDVLRHDLGGTAADETVSGESTQMCSTE